ncbi:hypothetical protein DL766_005193 [Monosporascus sp. MC13-8B]|uniref:Clr5 domain-containing protein n=1 Tax=Monosporascus cannonballus TaxID=155416 RepID=A0ABY0HD88_9PEZI|nr:hypothetical protein DL762_003573 [Monosporascus cannonballus]RYO98178.1 hypothetical protein DL763_002419 [Monosporascus cannonballus]RYP29828.1 hypothetical protein DL766_005193 [Monosporascus sp. MC13-8B]
MSNFRGIPERRPDSQCKWCQAQPDIFQGLCGGCDKKLRRKWKEYEAATEAMVSCEEALFDMSFAAAYGTDQFNTVVFNQERLALRNIQDSHMQRMAEYYIDLRARKVSSIRRCLPPTPSQRSVSLASSSTAQPARAGQRPGTSAIQLANLSEANERSDPLEHLRSEILIHWSPETDTRALVFVNDSIHTESFLKLLLKLAPFYSWEDTTRMVNSMIIERIHHGDYKQRCHIREDFWNALKICRDLDFVPTNPDAITQDELSDVNCRVYKWGLLKDGYDHGPNADSHGVCAEKHPCCEAEPTSTAFVFTYKYRNRCRHLRADATSRIRSEYSDEGYGGSANGQHERAGPQRELGSGYEQAQLSPKRRWR